MTSETEEAVARVKAWCGITTPKARTLWNEDLRTILSALSASQAEVERLGRDVNQFVTCMCGQPMSADHYALGHAPVSVAEHYYNEQYARAQAAEARATRAEAEVERLTRERDEAVHLVSETATAGRDNAAVLRRALNAELGRRAVAEARATRAEGLLAEAGEVLGRLYAAIGGVRHGASEALIEAQCAARAFLDKLKPADTPPPVTATDTGRNT